METNLVMKKNERKRDEPAINSSGLRKMKLQKSWMRKTRSERVGDSK
jgi:hypothetical protein